MLSGYDGHVRAVLAGRDVFAALYSAPNDGLPEYPAMLLSAGHGHELVSAIANGIVELCPGGVVDRSLGFDEHLADKRISELRDRCCHRHAAAEI